MPFARSAAVLLGTVMLTTPSRAETPTGQTAGVATRPEPSDGPRDLQSLLELRDGAAGQSLTIESETLELETRPDEGRLLTFERNVRVRQGDLELRADRLEADYPPQESEPRRLVARGSVQIDQPGQRAFCDEAEYLRESEQLICRGSAQLIQGCDVVAGESIEFDLVTNRVRVAGAARVVIAPRAHSGDCAREPVRSSETP